MTIRKNTLLPLICPWPHAFFLLETKQHLIIFDVEEMVHPKGGCSLFLLDITSERGLHLH